MHLRKMTFDDIQEIRKLHEKYYSQFDFPDFMHNFLCNFVILDDDDSIIMAGGVEPIAEQVLVSNLEKSIIKIGRALVEAKRIGMYACSKHGISELHAFVDNDDYAKHLMQHGFTPRSRALSLKVP